MRHNNPSISQDSNRIFDFKGENLQEVADFIQPVILIKRRIEIVKDATANNASSANIYTTPTDKDFYLVGAQLSMIKDATATSVSSYMTATLEGLTISVLNIQGFSLTAQNDSVSISLPNPLKIDRNTTIVIRNSTNVANIRALGIIYGYTVETTKGV